MFTSRVTIKNATIGNGKWKRVTISNNLAKHWGTKMKPIVKIGTELTFGKVVRITKTGVVVKKNNVESTYSFKQIEEAV